MPKITIDLPVDTNEKLKKKAKANYRSLTNYITVVLISLADDTTLPSITTPLPITPVEYNGRKIKSIVYEKEPAALSPEEQELSKLKLQQKKDNLRQKRVDYFKKKYKEIYGEFSMPNREVTTGLTTCRT